MLCSGPGKAQSIGLWVEGEIGVPRTRDATKRCAQVRALKERSRYERCGGIWIYVPDYPCRAAATSMAIGDDEIILDRFIRLNCQAASNVFPLYVTNPLLVIQVKLKAIAALEIACDTQQHFIVDDRHVDRTFGLKM